MATRKRASHPRPSRATVCADYSFRQRFRVPASFAFRWCIDYTEDDWKSSGGTTTRKVRWLGPWTVELEDTYAGPRGRRVRKVRIVQVYPGTRHWVSTHTGGPALHSQFRYTIVPAGRNGSALVFEGRELGWKGPRLSAAATRRRAKALRDEDAALWKRFAAEIAHDFAAA